MILTDRQVGGAIIALGVVQGLLFWGLDELWEAIPPGGSIAPWTIGAALASVIPTALQLTLPIARDARLLRFIAGLAAVLALLGWYCGATIFSPDRSYVLLASYIFTIGLGSFIAIVFAQNRFEFGRWFEPYRGLFKHTWDNLLILTVVYLVHGGVYLLELLWAQFYRAIGFETMAALFETPYILYPLNGLVVGWAMRRMQAQRGAVDVLRRVCFAIFRGLLIVLALMLIVFAGSLVYGGWPRFRTGMGATTMLLVQAAAILFVNAVYQDGGEGPPPFKRPLRLLVTAALALLPICTVMSVGWLASETIRDGWTFGRLWLALGTLVLGLYAVGYAYTALVHSDPWMRDLGAINTSMARIVLVLAVLVNTPLLDPKRIAADHQGYRLMRLSVAPETFDYDGLAELGTPGYRVLLHLAYQENHPLAETVRAKARAAFDNIGCGERLRSREPYREPVLVKAPGRIYLVPIGGLAIDLEAVAAGLEAGHDLDLTLLPRIEPGQAQWDTKRRQHVAEELVELIKRQHASVAAEPDAILIGVTARDMYIREKTWRFAFSWRDEGRFAVVSLARMDPAFYNRPEDLDKLRQRLRKMLLKNIGVMYFDLPLTADRRSVMCSPILGIDDLDSLGESY